MNTELVEIQPCPFCGGNGHVVPDPIAFHVQCDRYGCDVEGPYRDDRFEAIKAWNTRTLPTARIGEIVEALEGAASQCRTIQAGLEESANVASVGQHVESGDLRDSARAVFQVETKLQAALSTLSPTPVSEGEKAE